MHLNRIEPDLSRRCEPKSIFLTDSPSSQTPFCILTHRTGSKRLCSTTPAVPEKGTRRPAPLLMCAGSAGP